MSITDQQIRSFLARLGDAAPPAPDLDRLTGRAGPVTVTGRHRSAPRALAGIAAGVLLIVGVAAVAATQRESSPGTLPASAPLPPDPPGPLFVLPIDVDASPVSGGYVHLPDPEADLLVGTYLWAALGTPSDGGYDEVVGAWSLGDDARVDEFLSLGVWDEVETSTGPAHIWRTEPLSHSVIVQQRGTRWIRLAAAAVDDDELVQLLPAIELTETGTISVQSDERVVFAQGGESATPDLSTGFSVGHPGGEFWIETASMSHPLAAIGVVGDRVEPMMIGSQPGWLIAHQTEQGPTPYAVVWSATPRRIIAVGTSTDSRPELAELLDLAWNLQIVDESTWRAALPGATTETLQHSSRDTQNNDVRSAEQTRSRGSDHGV